MRVEEGGKRMEGGVRAHPRLPAIMSLVFLVIRAPDIPSDSWLTHFLERKRGPS